MAIKSVTSQCVRLFLLLTSVVMAGSSLGQGQDQDQGRLGKTIYDRQCAECHDGQQAVDSPTPAPSLAALQQMSAMRIGFALRNGKMREQGREIRRRDLGSLIGYLTNDESAVYQPSAASMCSESTRRNISTKSRIGSWGFDLQNTRSLTTYQAKIDLANVHRLTLKWAFGLPRVSEARSQPVITKDTIFLATVAGYLFALDRTTGCIKWIFNAKGPLRTALFLGELGEGGPPALFFAGRRTRVYALNPITGTVIWEQPIEISDASIITGSPVQYGDQVFVPISSHEVGWATNPSYECCTSRGAVAALKAGTGELQWLTSMIDEDVVKTFKNSRGVQQWGPSGAVVWTTPAIDAERGLIYLGTGENTSSPPSSRSDAIVALEMQTGKIRWTYQATKGDAYNLACVQQKPGPNCPPENGPDFDFGASVIIAKDSKNRPLLLAGQKSGEIHALDPNNNGELIWKRRVGGGTALGGVHWGMSVVGNRLFAPVADPELPRDGYTPSPGLYALNVDDGSRIWSSPVERGCKLEGRNFGDPWPACSFYYGLSAAVTATPELVFTAALDGKIRIYDSATGDVVWRFDTKREFDTVNGVSAHGGAIDNAGIQVADGLMVVQSGYLFFQQMPGNVLLVFEVHLGE